MVRFRSLWRNLRHRDRVERDLDDEMRAAFDLLVTEKIASGMRPEEARRAAGLELGGIESVKEQVRDVRAGTSVESLLRDLRYTARQLAITPGFTCTMILVVALGIGAAVTIFGFVDAALVRPLPYTDPSRLVTVFGARPALANAQARGSVSYLDFIDWRDRNRVFRSMAAYDVRAGFILTTAAGPQPVSGLRVTSDFFRTLGVAPALGREFERDEEGLSAPPTVMLANSAWQTRFARDPGIVGRTVTLQTPWLPQGEPHVVVGVLPPGFHFAMAQHAEFWTTIRGAQGCWDVRGCRSLEAIARLADNTSVDAAAASMTSVIGRLRAEYPDDHREPEIAKVVPMRDVVLGDVRTILHILLAAAGLLLLIAWINAVSLLLARSESRRREIALRNALGASSGRLVMQFATEAFVLSAAGCIAGLVLAVWGMRVLSGLVDADMVSRMPYLAGIGMSARLVAIGAGLSLVAWVLFALTPVTRTSSSDMLVGLGQGTRGSDGSRWRRFGAPLVVAELAVAMVLLVGAGLLGKSLYRLLHVDVGFNAHQLGTVSVSPVSAVPARRAGESAMMQEPSGVLAREVAERVAVLPGVIAVAYADLLPLGEGLAPSSTFWIPGRPEAAQLKEDWPVRRISAGYFEALEARLLRGRDFTKEEVAAVRPVAIINETAARRYFQGTDPIGRTLAFGGPDGPVREIVGVVADIKDGPPETPSHPSAYVPFDQIDFGLVFRALPSEHALFPSLAAAIRDVRPGVLVHGQSTILERMSRSPSTSMNRSSAWLVGGFAIVAFVLSVVGLYGVVAYSVGRRAREIGVRMALGARRSAIYGLVLGEASRLVVFGAMLGLVAAAPAGMLLRGVLFDVHAWDPTTFASAAAALIGAAFLATYIPARRAASVDPIEVLRAE